MFASLPCHTPSSFSDPLLEPVLIQESFLYEGVAIDGPLRFRTVCCSEGDEATRSITERTTGELAQLEGPPVLREPVQPLRREPGRSS
jgi:hypothetical protein